MMETTFNEVALFGDSNMGTMAKIDNQELLFDSVDVAIELPTLDDTVVRESFNGNTLAGDTLTYSFNRWGNLQVHLDKYVIKGRTLKAMYKELIDNKKYFQPTDEVSIDSKWSMLRGNLFPNKGNAEGSWLLRGESIIGFYKTGTNVARTIQWYEKAIYKGKSISFNRAHKTIDYRPEVRNDIYDTQEPEFTKEPELEEILSFITSLKGRKVSRNEHLLLLDIVSEIETI